MSDPADLSNLADIVVPAPVPWWPLAPGWWIVAVTVLVVLAILLVAAGRRWRRNAYRRQALDEIDALGAISGAAGVTSLSAVLKRTALVAFPRQQVAALTGADWLAFLDRTGGGGRFHAADLVGAAYGGQVKDGAELSAAARRWVKRHRAEG